MPSTAPAESLALDRHQPRRSHLPLTATSRGGVTCPRPPPAAAESPALDLGGYGGQGGFKALLRLCPHGGKLVLAPFVGDTAIQQ